MSIFLIQKIWVHLRPKRKFLYNALIEQVFGLGVDKIALMGKSSRHAICDVNQNLTLKCVAPCSSG